jgi:hypothetical protein
MMQKVINVIALLSGLTSLAVISGGVYLYKNADVMIEDARKNVASAAVEAISDALPGLIDAAMPDIPEVTGPEVPFGETGPNIRLP